MICTSDSECNSYDKSHSLLEIFRHDYDNYYPSRSCRCKVKADLMTAKTANNPGRRFYTCSIKACRFFAWHDGEFPQRCVELINKLRDELRSPQATERIINRLPDELSLSRKMLMISVLVNVLLLLVIAYMLGKM
ncbi:hypothetical protein ACFE04_016506 [Oxalis oulophora]